jgi:putative aldouronate transport system permease protein
MIRRRSAGDLLFDVLNVTLLILLCISILYPFLNQLTMSLSTKSDAEQFGIHVFPNLARVSLDSYRRVLLGGSIPAAFYWTLVRTVFGTLITVLVTIMMAYPLAKRYLPYRNFWTLFVVFTMFFSGGLIPSFLLIRDLKLMNSVWALILPGVAAPFSLIIARNFMMSISEELAESARIDGANDVVILFAIYIPVSMPIIATLALWSMVGHWNAWFDAMIYIQKPPVKILQEILRRVLTETTFSTTNIDQQAMQMEYQDYTPDTVRAAILMVVTLPVVFSYPFFQRYFVKGIMVGSLKG